MRVALQIRSVFEGTGLAFVNVDSHEPRRRLFTHNAPLAPCWKTSATQATQTRIFHGFDNGFSVELAANHFP